MAKPRGRPLAAGRRSAKQPKGKPRGSSAAEQPVAPARKAPGAKRASASAQARRTGRGEGRAAKPPARRVRADAKSTRPPHKAKPQPSDRAPAAPDTLARRWSARGDALLAELAAHGADQHEVRVDLKQGKFVWIGPDGSVSVAAPASVLCSWSRATEVLVMAWGDPLLRAAGVARIDRWPAERDAVSEEQAWGIAMEAADAARAKYLYRMTTPHASYFLALGELTFAPDETAFVPTSPVGLVLRGLSDTRQAVESLAEPAVVVRDRLIAMGTALLDQAGYAYRDTDWVARLERTGKRLLHLAQSVPRPSYGSVAAGQATEWLERDTAEHLVETIGMLEDEWQQFV